MLLTNKIPKIVYYPSSIYMYFIKYYSNMNPVETYQESRMICPRCFWDVLSGTANLCGKFCPGCQKMAWDILFQDVLSGSQNNELNVCTCILRKIICWRNTSNFSNQFYTKCLHNQHTISAQYWHTVEKSFDRRLSGRQIFARFCILKVGYSYGMHRNPQ